MATALVALVVAGSVFAQPGKAVAEEGVRWQDLKPAQKEALKPLERQWPSIDSTRKQKWLGVSGRYQKMSPDEQSRLHDRMNEWAKLTPEQRGAARLHFQEAKQVPAQDRQARWNAYQALPAEKKRELAERATPKGEASERRSTQTAVPRPGVREPAQPKSNLVPNPALAAPPKPVAPTVMRAGPGATTTLMSRRPAPPSHQQTGLPKIAATPGFVNRSTLLPEKGPQAAGAVRTPAQAPAAPASSR